MRVAVVATALSCSLIGLSIADPAIAAAIRKPINIPPQELALALQTLAKDRDFQIVCRADLVKGLRSTAVSGELTPYEALSQLLNGTGLTYRALDDQTITIVPIAAAPASSSRETSANASQAATRDTPDAQEAQKNSSFWDRFRLAQVDQGATSRAVAPATSSSSDAGQAGATLEQVVVTAQKREERLQEVPVPVTAISASTLVESNQSRLQDYYTRIPGLDLSAGAIYGSPAISIRGITTGTEISPTVGIVTDDVSYTSSHPYLHGYTVTEIDPSDLKSVEVLRGPQGTLYGASSMGGLLKYVTVDPSTERVAGQLRVGTSAIDHGDGLGHYFSGALNVPVSADTAVRVSAFTRMDPGYIDDPLTHRESKNQATSSGARLAALWRPSEVTSLKLSALFQEYELDAPSYVTLEPGLGELQQDVVPGARNYKTIQVYSANLEQGMGPAHLTSIAAYTILDNRDTYDLTYYFRGLALPYGVTKSASPAFTKARRFTEETRVSIPLFERVEWLLGGLYVHIDGTNSQPVYVNDGFTGANVAEIAFQSYKIPLEEYAAFTNLTFHVTGKLDVQFGGRKNWIEQKFTGFLEGSLVGNTTIGFAGRSSENSFTYLLTPRYRFSDDLMVYARIATGYRPGGPNTAVAPGVPAQYSPDRTRNYEVGTKGRILDGRMTFDASLYRIDWDSIQLGLFNILSYTGNGGSARSQGAELSLDARITDRLKMSGWLAFSDAELTEDFPATATVAGRNGARLPFSSRFSGSTSLDYEFPVAHEKTAFVGASIAHVGSRLGDFEPGGVSRAQFDSYFKADLRAGIRNEAWTLNVYANNVANRYVLFSQSTVNPADYAILQPRTIGASLSMTF